MNATIMLLGTLVPMLAASLFYVSDRRAARQTSRASPADDQQE